MYTFIYVYITLFNNYLMTDFMLYSITSVMPALYKRNYLVSYFCNKTIYHLQVLGNVCVLDRVSEGGCMGGWMARVKKKSVDEVIGSNP